MGGIFETVKGVIENVVYRNEENDYCVIEIVDGDNNLITAVGNMPMPFEGENVTLTGSFTYHKEFGRQFAFESFEKTLPDEIEGIIQYLSSRTVKGIGPVTALKIVNRFGTDTFDVIENHPEWLVDVPGITMKKAAAISESFREQTGLRNVMMFCKDYMDRAEVNRVYKRFGAGAVGMIKENPYILCHEHYGIPFEKADAIARDFGISPESYDRILAGVSYTLTYNAGANGHTCLPFDKLSAASAAILELDEETVGKSISRFIEQEELVCYLHEGTRYVMKREVAECEEYIAYRISEMDKYSARFSTEDIRALIDNVERRFGISYADLQREAIFEALRGSIMILTGGPGTGKTTVVKGLISIFDSIGHRCVLAAPTGRAAKRLSEATGEEAKTIHRLLEMERVVDDVPRFNRDASRPIEENVVIVDEASMIDLNLACALFRAIKRGARLILIGDTDQLPSVGAGNVLADLIASERVRTVCLVEIFRQAKESLIVTNAHRINGGEDPLLNRTDSDFFFVRRENEGELVDTVADLIANRLPRAYGKEIRSEIQVIAPSKKGSGGTLNLNSALQGMLNPPAKFKREVRLHGTVFREGDKVMQTANNYETEWEKNGVTGMGVFNGDIGFIELIDTAKEQMRIRFDDRVAVYSYDMADELELAYAITVHKSQGSEYPVVIIPSFWCAPMLMTRNLLYTAVTRAKRMVVIVGRSDIPSRMVANNLEVMRYTTLGYRIARI
ncbi:MAG: ATP-dependent RecD-like DNA helicase [Clostridia bacterium]|nr:ATP-dependent RecD-like DNA helicase [Clostridia bacterium]